MFVASFYTGIKIYTNRDFIFLGFGLPVLGFVITTVIGTNIALSLGMVGALSIIRFRTPVRSSYELIIYFALLTMGIATSVDFRYTLIFVTILLFFMLIYKSLDNRSFFNKFLSNKNKLDDKIKVNLTLVVEKNEVKNLINENEYISFSCENINDNQVEINIYKLFNKNEDLQIYLDKNNKLIKNFDLIKSETN